MHCLAKSAGICELNVSIIHSLLLPIVQLLPFCVLSATLCGQQHSVDSDGEVSPHLFSCHYSGTVTQTLFKKWE